MKIKIIAIALSVVLLGAAMIYELSARPEPVVIVQDDVEKANALSAPVPAFDFMTMAEEKLALSDLKQDTILIHFWAGWCSVCFGEFPALLERTKNAEGKIALLAIAIDDDLPLIESFIERLQKQGTKTDIDNVYWIWDEGQKISLQTFNTIRVPETIIVDKNRMMTRKIVGPVDWTEQELPSITPP